MVAMRVLLLLALVALLALSPASAAALRRGGAEEEGEGDSDGEGAVAAGPLGDLEEDDEDEDEDEGEGDEDEGEGDEDEGEGEVVNAKEDEGEVANAKDDEGEDEGEGGPVDISNEEEGELEEDEDSADPVLEEDEEGDKKGDEEKKKKIVPKKKPAQDSAYSAINRDIRAFEESIAQSTLTQAAKKNARNDIEAIKRDSARSVSASEDQKARLHKAINLRMRALKLILGQPAASFEEEEMEHRQAAVDKVLGDVKGLELRVDQGRLSKASRKTANDILMGVRKDSTEMMHASPTRRAALGKAMNLRVQALRKILDDKPVAQESHHKPRAGGLDLERVVDKAVHGNKRAATRHAAKPQKIQTQASRIKAEVKAISKQLEGAAVPAAKKKRAQKNLDALLRDAEEMTTAPVARKKLLAKAASLRMSSIKRELDGF